MRIFLLALLVAFPSFGLNYVDSAYLAKGGTNWIKNGGAESARQGWITYADAAGTSPVDCTGGSPSVTWTTSTTTPISEKASFLFTHPASNRQGDGASYAFTIDNSEKTRQQQISFDYEISSGTFAAGVVPIGGATAVDSDLEVYVYDVTNSALIQPSNYRLLQNSGEGRYTATFQAASNSTSYRLCLHAATTSATAHTLRLDSVKVGPQIVTVGAPMSDMTAYTPTITGFGTASGVVGYFRRVGDHVDILAYWVSGTTSGSAASITLPAGLTVDSAKVATNNLVGSWTTDTNAAGTPTVMTVGGSNNLFMGLRTASASGFTSAAGTTVGSAGMNVSLRASVPILGWSSGNASAQAGDDTRPVAFQVNSPGSGTPSTSYQDVPFGTVSLDTHGAFSGSTYTVPYAGTYIFFGQFDLNGSVTSGATARVQFTKNGTGLGPEGATQASANQELLPNLTFEGSFKAGDTVKLQAKYGGTVTGPAWTGAGTFFSGFRLNGGAQLTAQDSVAAKYNITSVQSVTGSAKIAFGIADRIFDYTGMFDDPNDRLIVPAAGTYRVSGTWRAASGTTNIQGFFKKNGVSGELMHGTTANASNITAFSGSETYRCVAGDYFELWASSGAAINFQDNILAVERIGN